MFLYYNYYWSPKSRAPSLAVEISTFSKFNANFDSFDEPANPFVVVVLMVFFASSFACYMGITAFR